MVEIVKSATFDRWLRKLKDRRAAARVLVRIDRLAAGNPGDVKPVGSGISELRIDYGPGYRVYYLQEGQRLIVLLCAGDKSSQDRDIEQANRIAEEWKNDEPRRLRRSALTTAPITSSMSRQLLRTWRRPLTRPGTTPQSSPKRSAPSRAPATSASSPAGSA